MQASYRVINSKAVCFRDWGCSVF